MSQPPILLSGLCSLSPCVTKSQCQYRSQGHDFCARALRLVGDQDYQGAAIMLPRGVCFAAFFLSVSVIAASVGSYAQEQRRAAPPAPAARPAAPPAMARPAPPPAMARPAAPAFRPVPPPQRPAMAPRPTPQIAAP